MNGIQDSHRTRGGHSCSPHLDAGLGALQCLLGTNGCHHSKHQVHIGQQLEARVWSLGWGRLRVVPRKVAFIFSGKISLSDTPSLGVFSMSLARIACHPPTLLLCKVK